MSVTAILSPALAEPLSVYINEAWEELCEKPCDIPELPHRIAVPPVISAEEL